MGSGITSGETIIITWINIAYLRLIYGYFRHNTMKYRCSEHVSQYLSQDPTENKVLRPPTLHLHGKNRAHSIGAIMKRKEGGRRNAFDFTLNSEFNYSNLDLKQFVIN